MVDNTQFYRAFEDRHRGSRELVKSRVAVYLPFIMPLTKFYESCLGIDLGCGRGEWLELANENKIDILGVDLDQGMLDVAKGLGLNAIQGDAILALQSLSNESQVIVTGFHLAEHLEFGVLQVLIEESLRVLKPGGLLILETPNPENITVGATSFYIDPTHQRPIPSELLVFMVEYAGFEKIKALRLQENGELFTNNSLGLHDVLKGVSPDYAVVAQKSGAVDIVSAIAPVFATDYGLSLEALATMFTQQAESKAQRSEITAQQAESKAQRSEITAQQAESKAQRSEITAQQAESKAQRSEEKLLAMVVIVDGLKAEINHVIRNFEQLQSTINAYHQSTSWRITAPLRCVRRCLNKLHMPSQARVSIVKFVQLSIKQLVSFSCRTAMHNPFLKKKALNYLARRPSLKAMLRRIYFDSQKKYILALNDDSFSDDTSLSVPSGIKKDEAVNRAQKSPLESFFY